MSEHAFARHSSASWNPAVSPDCRRGTGSQLDQLRCWEPLGSFRSSPSRRRWTTHLPSPAGRRCPVCMCCVTCS